MSARLALSWKPGAVAPDGTIWGDHPSVRWTSGLIALTEIEALKAAEFGWKRQRVDVDGRILVERPWIVGIPNLSPRKRQQAYPLLTACSTPVDTSARQKTAKK